jgi:hypothetical protein
VRGFGGSLLGGLVRCNELRSGRIEHGVAMLLSDTQMKHAERSSDQHVWPAMVADANSERIYKGLIPMGSLVGIPRSVDLAALHLTPEGLALALAYQRYGGYVVDTAIHTMTLAVLENGCDRTSIDHLFADRRKIRDQLALVTNNAPEHVGGPGVRMVTSSPLRISRK